MTPYTKCAAVPQTSILCRPPLLIQSRTSWQRFGQRLMAYTTVVPYAYNIIIHTSIHIWRYSPIWALASLIRHLHSSLFAALLLHPLIPSSCSASLWTTSTHLVVCLPTGLVAWKFPFRTFFGILSSSILIIWPAHSSLLILMSSTMFGSLYQYKL